MVKFMSWPPSMRKEISSSTA